MSRLFSECAGSVGTVGGDACGGDMVAGEGVGGGLEEKVCVGEGEDVEGELSEEEGADVGCCVG